MQKNILCAIYTRVSTDNQAEVEFNSCEAQKEKIEHFIKGQEGFSVYGVFNDEGYSAKDLNRPAMQRMLREIKQSKINCVVTYKMDRLTRSAKDFYQLIEYFDKYDVDFISITERYDTSIPSGRLLRNIILTYAQFERELASERTKDKLLQKAQKGMWNCGTTPYGYRRMDKRLVIEEKEADVVRLIFKKYIDTGSISCIYNLLREDGVLDRKGRTFSKSAIGYILRNIVYIGKIRYDGKIYQGIHEPIVSEETFNLAQSRHKKALSHLRKYRELLFAGLIKCKECGSYMTPHYAVKIRKGERKRHYYYRCTSTFKRHWKSCAIRQVNADKIEKFVLDNLRRVLQDGTYIDDIIFRLNYLQTKGRYPIKDESSSINQSGFAQDQGWVELSPEVFRQNLKNFLFSMEGQTASGILKLIKSNVESIQYSKEMVRVRMYYEPLNGGGEDGAIKPDMPICITIYMYIVGNELGSRKKKN